MLQKGLTIIAKIFDCSYRFPTSLSLWLYNFTTIIRNDPHLPKAPKKVQSNAKIDCTGENFVQAGSAMSWNWGVILLLSQFWSVLSEIFTVFFCVFVMQVLV